MSESGLDPTLYRKRTRLTVGTAPAWLFAVVVVATTYEVIARYFFRAPTVWANEMSLWVCALGYIYAGIYAMSQDRHLRITAIYDAVPGRVRKAFDVVQCVVIIAFCAALSVSGFAEAWEALVTWEKYGTEFNAPIPATIKPLIVVSGVAMAAYAIRNLIRRLRAKGE